MNSLSTQQKKEIEEILLEFGLDKKEKEVYLTLLREGQSTLSPLSHRLKMPLTTVSSILSRLFEHGIIEITKHKSRQVYEALDPSVFKKILEEKTKHMAHIVPLLQMMKNETSSKTKIRIFYRDRMRDLFFEALKSKQKVLHEIVSAKDIQDILGERFHFSRRRVEKNIHLKSLRVESQEIKKYSKEKHRRELREAKFLPREMNFTGSIFLWDDTVAILSTHTEGLGILIESKSIHDMIQQMFNLLWSIGRKMETD